jgi:hypothetical protein
MRAVATDRGPHAQATAQRHTRQEAARTISQAQARPNASGAKIRQQAPCAIGAARVDCPQKKAMRLKLVSVLNRFRCVVVVDRNQR